MTSAADTASSHSASAIASKRIGSACRMSSGRSVPGAGTTGDGVRRNVSVGNSGTSFPSPHGAVRRPLSTASATALPP